MRSAWFTIVLAMILAPLLGVPTRLEARASRAAAVTQAPALPGAPPIAASDRVYTADQTSNTVSVYDPSTNRLLGTIPLGAPRPNVLSPLYNRQVDVHGLGFSPDGTLLAVISPTSNGVTVIETATNTVRGTVYVGRAPHEGFFTPGGRELWVTVRGQDYISVIDPVRLIETRRVSTADGPGMVVFRPDGKYAFVGHSRTAEVDVVATETYAVVARIPVVSPFSPNLVATPDGQEVWLTHKDVGKVTRIDARTFTVLEVLDTGKTTNHVNAVSTPTGDFIYTTVGGSDEVVIIRRGRGASSRIVDRVRVGATPHGIWPSPDNSRVYIGLEDGDGIQVLDTATNQAIKTIRGGQAPQALVYVAGAVPTGDGRQGLTRQNAGLPVAKFKLRVPGRPFAFLPGALPNAKGTAVVRQLDGVDSLELTVEGLPPLARFTAFLTQLPGPPFGAAAYLLDFKTDASGKAMAGATAVLFDAFLSRADEQVPLDRLVIWAADPATLAPVFDANGMTPPVTPFDADGQAGPVVLTDATDDAQGSALLNIEFA